jgi:cell division protein FtsB
VDFEAADLDRDDGPDGTPPRPRLSLRRLTRRHLALAMGGLVAAWIALVIAGAVGDSSAVNERAAALRIENADLQARLDMTRREAELVQGDAYVSLEARAFGMGRGNERSFSLQPGAPPPPRLRLLGEDPDEASPSSPLDDWLALLFGA